MPKKSSRHNRPKERIKIKFLGLKCECINPSAKTVIILMILLIFFAVLVAWVPHLVIQKWLSG